MNETKPLKLHKSHKIVCFIVCFVIVFSTFFISSFADTGVFNLVGTYNFRIPANDMIGDIYSATEENILFPSFTAVINGAGFEDIEATIRLVGVNYLQMDSGSVTLIHAEGQNPFAGFTVEATVGELTQTFTAISVNFSTSGNTVNFLDGQNVITASFTGMPAYMTFAGHFTTGGIDTDYFIEYFGRIEEYDGNPWADILNGVVEALDVNIFGTFSYLDIVSTLAGACLAIWLLKMLAGG